MSSSSSTEMDQEIFWNSMLLDPTESQSMPNYLLSPSHANMSYFNMSTPDSAGLSMWNAGGSSSPVNQGGRDEAKVEHGWSTSLTIGAGSGPRLEERRFEAANMLSLENVDINLNSTLMDEGQSFLQNSNLSDVPKGPELNAALMGTTGEVSESRMQSHTYNTSIINSEHVPSSSTIYGSSSGVVGYMPEYGDSRTGSSSDSRRLACKRKNTEGFPGQSSTSGSAGFFHPSETSLVHSVSATHNANSGIPISSQAGYVHGSNTSEEQLSPRFGTISREITPEASPPATLPGIPERSHRNFRLRINPALRQDIIPPNLYSSRDVTRHSSIWSPDEPSSHPIPFNQGLEYRPVAATTSSQSQHHVRPFSGLSQHVHSFLWDGATNTRIGSSSTSANLAERVMAMRENARTMPRVNTSEQPLLFPTIEARQLAPDSTNSTVASGSESMAGNVSPISGAGTSSAIHSLRGLPWAPAPAQSPATHFSRSLAEAVRRSLFSSGGSDSGGQSSNPPSQHAVHSADSQEIHNQSGSGFRGNPQPHLRSALILDRESDGVPSSVRSLAAREGRSRMMSEIRNALDQMRRGGNLRFEDVFMFDQSVFRSAGELHDRHRDMRLDVDNMSYEELLALEERIGNVSTGLSEEMIWKHLRQQKHSTVAVGASTETEPCSICQEEYMEGEDLGLLGCGHDFHTGCIKQWLTHKNLCPICKTTALVT